MAVIKKITRRRFSITSLIRLTAIGCLFLLVYTSIFVRAETVNLSAEIQDVQAKIDAVELLNENLRVEVSKLASYQNVAKIAASEGLTNQQNNIVTIREQR